MGSQAVSSVTELVRRSEGQLKSLMVFLLAFPYLRTIRRKILVGSRGIYMGTVVICSFSNDTWYVKHYLPIWKNVLCGMRF